MKNIIKIILKHRLNLIGFGIGLALFLIGMWQVDLLCSPYVWRYKFWQEVLPFWYMWSTEAYCMFLVWMMMGFLIALVSLWFWEDK